MAVIVGRIAPEVIKQREEEHEVAVRRAMVRRSWKKEAEAKAKQELVKRIVARRGPFNGIKVK